MLSVVLIYFVPSPMMTMTTITISLSFVHVSKTRVRILMFDYVDRNKGNIRLGW